jgi:hypothetical protein
MPTNGKHTIAPDGEKANISPLNRLGMRPAVNAALPNSGTGWKPTAKFPDCRHSEVAPPELPGFIAGLPY